ncbi:MAG: Gfo/Idh/MocA family oxidoreductase [Planctomycetes bacterium]|nr:Gfo/Idh/MocA family oxidoreductase [Planctomycetota bacterium]
MLGFAIVGCGMIARFHARALADVPNTKVTALVSRSAASAQKMKDELKLSCDIATDLDTALKREDVDVVIITTPSGAHMEPAVASANAGKHVVVEKPLEITLERCDRIIEACAKNKVQLCTIFPSRFGDAAMELHKAVGAGRFGRLTLGETTCKWWREQSYYDLGGWKGTQALDGGGALMNQAIHNVDLLLWMMGDVTHIMGFTTMLAHERIEVEDTAVACLRFKSGALGVIQATTSIWPGLPKTIAVHGDQGSVVIEQDDLLRWDFKSAKAEDDAIRQRFAQKVGASGGSSNPASISHIGHARQLADFVSAIQTGRAPLVDGREGRKAVEVILGIYASNRTGKCVAIP